MIEKDVLVTTKYGVMPSVAIHTDQPGDFPPVIFYMDALGMRTELRNTARRVAKAGYYCLLPDLYYRLKPIRFDTARRTDDMATVWRACHVSVSNEMVVDDTAGMLGWLDEQAQLRPGKVGCLGYCMSGQYVTTVAARFPHRLLRLFRSMVSGSLRTGLTRRISCSIG